LETKQQINRKGSSAGLRPVPWKLSAFFETALQPAILQSVMAYPIYVDAYSGYLASERPRQFQHDEDLFEMEEIEDR